MGREVVLLVDDDKEFLSELEDALASSGYIPVMVTNGADALKAARALKPGVILLDFKLGGENGFEVARKLRKAPATAKTPIIMMSGCFAGPGGEALLLPSDINIYLSKPFTQREVVRGIQTVLMERRTAGIKNGFDLVKRLVVKDKRNS